MHPQLDPHHILRSGLRGFETWFLDKLWNTSWTRDEARAAYAAIFPPVPEAGQKMTYEKGPWYWQHLDVPERLGMVAPKAKILMFLRDPAHWLHSLFYPLSSSGHSLHTINPLEPQAQIPEASIKMLDNTFIDSLMGPEGGFNMCKRLPVTIKNLLKHYPRESLLIHFTEEFKHRPTGVLTDIENSLGLTPFDWDKEALDSERKLTYHKVIRPPISDWVFMKVRDECKAAFKEVEKLLSLPDLYAKWDAYEDERRKKKKKIRKFNPKTRKLEWVVDYTDGWF